MSFLLKPEPFESHATVPNAFAPHECAAIRTFFSDMKEGVVGNEQVAVKTIRDSRVAWLYCAPNTQWIYERIASLVTTINDQYFGMDLKTTESIQLTEYDSEYQGFYGQHTDSMYGPTGASRGRKLSITMQLSDPTDYEGGELKLYWQNFKEPFTASREMGTMTLFRSHIIHEVMPVTKGKRLSMVTWVNGPLFR